MLMDSECFIYTSSRFHSSQLLDTPEVASDILSEEIALVKKFVMPVSKVRAGFIAASWLFFVSCQVTSSCVSTMYHLQAGVKENITSNEPQTERVVTRGPTVMARKCAL